MDAHSLLSETMGIGEQRSGRYGHVAEQSPISMAYQLDCITQRSWPATYLVLIEYLSLTKGHSYKDR